MSNWVEVEVCLEPFFFSFSVDSFSGWDGMDRMVIWQQLNFFLFPLLREVVKIKKITSLGAYHIHRLTWIPQKLQPETCLFPIVKREKGLSVKPTLHVVHSLHLHKGHKEVEEVYLTRRWRTLLHLCGNSHLLQAWQEVGMVDESLTYQWEVVEPAGASPQLDLKRIKANLSSSELSWSPSKPAESSSDGWNCG